MELHYLIIPFWSWLVAGSLKFAINSFNARRWAFDLIGYGRLPSNHAAMVSGVTALIGIREGIEAPVFGVAITLAFIVILDAKSLRLQVGKQAEAINILRQGLAGMPVLRERMGHTPIELLAGVVTGLCAAAALNFILPTA